MIIEQTEGPAVAEPPDGLENLAPHNLLTYKYGAANYRWRRTDTSTIMNELYVRYNVESITMPYVLQDYCRDYTKKHLHELTIEERLDGLSVDERLRGMSVEEVLQHLPKDEILKSLPKEEIEAYLKRQKRKPARKK